MSYGDEGGYNEPVVMDYRWRGVSYETRKELEEISLRRARRQIKHSKRALNKLFTSNQDPLLDLEDLGKTLRYRNIESTTENLKEVRKLAQMISLKLKELAGA